jgi:addiction module HigA family antidote
MGVTQSSPAYAKVALFRSHFRGREAVYPRRFESRKSGKSGYMPACAHEWVRGVCEKPRIKCSDCQITQVEAVRQLRVSTTRLNEIIRGKRGITADTAWRLGDWLGTGPDVWMNLQSKWDLWQARKVRKTA